MMKDHVSLSNRDCSVVSTERIVLYSFGVVDIGTTAAYVYGAKVRQFHVHGYIRVSVRV
jgi:hypothetical protein